MQKDCASCMYRISSLEEYTIQDHDLYKINRINFKLKKRSMILPISDIIVDPTVTAYKLIKYPDTEKKDKIKFNLFNITKGESPFEIFELPYSVLSEFTESLKEQGYSPAFLAKYRNYIVEA